MNRETYYQILAGNDTVVLFMFVVGILGAILWSRFKPFPLKLWHILMGAVLIRLPYLGESLWYDETFTTAMSRLSFDQLGNAILADVHPPLAYLPFWAWAQVFGSSDMVIRLPSLIMGLVSIWLAYHIMQTINPHRALDGALAVAILPTHLIYSTEARAYMLLTILVMVMVLAIIRNRPAWFLVGALLPYVHAHGYIYLMVFGVIAIIKLGQFFFDESNQDDELSYPFWITAFGICAMSAVAYIPIMLYQSGDVSDGFWLRHMGIGGVLGLLPNVLIGGRYLPILSIILIPLTFALTIQATRKQWQNPTIAILFVVALCAPLMTFIIATITGLPIVLARAMIPTGILWAIIIMSYKPKLYFALVAIPLFYGVVSDYQRMDIRGVMTTCEGSDVVYAVSTTSAIMAHHYSPNVVAPHDSDDINQVYPLELFGIPRANWDDLQGDVCVVYLSNPLRNEAHKIFVSNLRPYRTKIYSPDDYTRLGAYRVITWMP
jgi:uncharacterized membrane protein